MEVRGKDGGDREGEGERKKGESGGEGDVLEEEVNPAMCYAMSAMYYAYVLCVSAVWYAGSTMSYALSGMSYAVPGTKKAYGSRSPLCTYARTTPCPVLRLSLALRPCPVLRCFEQVWLQGNTEKHSVLLLHAEQVSATSFAP
eukprot:1492709-Rhodomonas_salina.3